MCRLALCENDTPYLVPLSYGYANNTLYFHSAAEGKKIEILKTNPKVCFEVESNVEVVTAPLPCNWGMKYESVAGSGIAEFIEDSSAKKEALKVIMGQYGSPDADNMNAETIEKTLVFKVRIKNVSGKRSGF